MTCNDSSNRLTGFENSKPYGTVFSTSPLPTPRMKRPRDRWSTVSAAWASDAGWRRTVSTTHVAIGTFSVSTATAPATVIPSR